MSTNAAAALAAIADDELRARFDPDAMDEVHPTMWHEGDEALACVVNHVQGVRAFYQEIHRVAQPDRSAAGSASARNGS